MFQRAAHKAQLNTDSVPLPVSTELTDAIRKDWGGKPFVDMIKGWKHVLHDYPEVDPDRAVAAGASWGGYAIKCVGLFFFVLSRAALILLFPGQLDSRSSRIRLRVQGAVLS